MLSIEFNDTTYSATYNQQTGYFELNLVAPDVGGIYSVDATYTDPLGEVSTDSEIIRVILNFIEVQLQPKTFMWIFDHKDLSVKGCVEIQDYEINIDEETNATSMITILKDTGATARDYIVIKKNNEKVYWGVIQEISNNDGDKVYTYTTKYISNMFDRNIKLENEALIRSTGIEDFLADAITNNFISNSDTFINLDYLVVNPTTHTKKETSVSNVGNGIYNLHTWLTNCTQNYDIVYDFDIDEIDGEYKLVVTIKNQSLTKEIIDTNAQPISNYNEVFETDVTAKVTCLYDMLNDEENPGQYTIYLKTDRTTTTNALDPDRAEGKVALVYTQNGEDAPQEALNVIKGNSYNHNITFDYKDRYIKVGTPIAIKTKKSIIYDTYISAIRITQRAFIQYTCGNIRVNFIDKLLKEKEK